MPEPTEIPPGLSRTDYEAMNLAAAVVGLFRARAKGDPKGIEKARRALAGMRVAVRFHDDRRRPTRVRS